MNGRFYNPGIPASERRHRRIEAWPVMKNLEARSDPHHMIRIDPAAAFLLFFAVAAMIALYVFSPGFTDLTTQATKYVVILVLASAAAPITVGGYFYREWGPITRPLHFGKSKKAEFPDIALIGIVAGFLVVGAADTLLTNFGFFPTLSFWNSLTPQIFYASGGIIEEFVFRAVLLGTINRFAPVLLENRLIFVFFTGPLNSGVFTIYHLVVYASSKVALDLVFVESLVIVDGYRGFKYPLWAFMVLHAAINWTAAP